MGSGTSSVGLREVLQKHLNHGGVIDPTATSILRQLTPRVIEAATKKHLTTHQANVLNEFATKSFIESVAGAGNTTVATVLIAAVSTLMEPVAASTIVYLLPNRVARDDAMESTRGIVQDPLDVVSLGRPVADMPAEDDDQIVDAVTAARVEESLRWHYWAGVVRLCMLKANKVRGS